LILLAIFIILFVRKR